MSAAIPGLDLRASFVRRLASNLPLPPVHEPLDPFHQCFLPIELLFHSQMLIFPTSLLFLVRL